MSNETFVILMPLIVLTVMITFGGLLCWDIVRRHPVKKKRPATVAAGSSDDAEPSKRTAVPGSEILENEELNLQLATRVRENAATTARIVREANQLAASIEGFTKAVTGAK